MAASTQTRLSPSVNFLAPIIYIPTLAWTMLAFFVGNSFGFNKPYFNKLFSNHYALYASNHLSLGFIWGSIKLILFSLGYVFSCVSFGVIFTFGFLALIAVYLKD